MSIAILILLVFLGGLGFSTLGSVIYYREDIKPMIEKIEKEQERRLTEQEIYDIVSDMKKD